MLEETASLRVAPSVCRAAPPRSLKGLVTLSAILAAGATLADSTTNAPGSVAVSGV